MAHFAGWGYNLNLLNFDTIAILSFASLQESQSQNSSAIPTVSQLIILDLIYILLTGSYNQFQNNESLIFTNLFYNPIFIEKNKRINKQTTRKKIGKNFELVVLELVVGSGEPNGNFEKLMNKLVLFLVSEELPEPQSASLEAVEDNGEGDDFYWNFDEEHDGN